MFLGEKQMKVKKKLTLPAIRAEIGDWIYYSTIFSFQKIKEHIIYERDLHTPEKMSEMLQREREPRAKLIIDYIKEQEQMFFNSLIVGVYKGSPKWYGFSSEADKNEEINKAKTMLGVLELSADTKLYAIDGQHRVYGITKAFETDSKYSDEEISVLLVSYNGDIKNEKGRYRRLFTTLNKYAVKPNKKYIIALDEDHIASIVTRELVEERYFPLFTNKISIKKGKSISRDDLAHFTTVITIWDVINIYLRGDKSETAWKQYVCKRPRDADIAKQCSEIVEVFDLLCEFFPELMRIKNATPSKNLCEKYRHKEGGHLLFRPIGLTILFTVLTKFTSAGKKLKPTMLKLSKIPMELNEYPWKGLLYVNKKMVTASENQKLAQKIIYIYCAGNLDNFQKKPINIEDVKRDYKVMTRVELSKFS